MNKDDFKELFYNIAWEEEGDKNLKQFENDLTKTYMYISSLPEDVFDGNLSKEIENRSSLMRVLTDSLEIKYFNKLYDRLEKEMIKEGLIEGES